MKHLHLMILAYAITWPVRGLAEDKKTAADNTSLTEKDRTPKTPTAGDQSERPEDRKLTQLIRQAVMKDQVLSVSAKNVKIITVTGKVTLRGSVNSSEEKAKIYNLAKEIAGPTSVDNQLEVKISQ